MDILCKKTSNQIDVPFKQIVRTCHWHKTPLPLEMRKSFRKRNKQQFVQQLQIVLPNIKNYQVVSGMWDSGSLKAQNLRYLNLDTVFTKILAPMQFAAKQLFQTNKNR